MSTPDVLDFEALLAPISEAQPCGTSYDSGENILLSQLFSELRTLTNVARHYEKNRYLLASGALPSDQQTEPPNWWRIAELSLDILSHHSKDTRAMVGLVESSARLHSLPGFRDAFKVCAAMIEQYKLDLFPATEPGEQPHYCLEFLGKICESEVYNLQSAIYQAELFEESPGFTWFSYLSATQLDKQLHKTRDKDERDQLLQSNPMTLEQFRAKLTEFRTRAAFRVFDDRVSEALAAAQQLDRSLASLSDNQVGLTRIVTDLTALQRWYRQLTDEYLAKLPPEPTAGEGADALSTEAEGLADPNNAGTAVNGGIALPNRAVLTREQALNSLTQVAAYFRATEPHSPLSYALEQAVRWGKLTLPELLRELVSDTSVLAQVYQRMGIQENADKSGD